MKYACNDCTIRLLAQATEWRSDLVFWSCADVIIFPHPNISSCKTVRNRRDILISPLTMGPENLMSPPANFSSTTLVNFSSTAQTAVVTTNKVSINETLSSTSTGQDGN